MSPRKTYTPNSHRLHSGGFGQPTKVEMLLSHPVPVLKSVRQLSHSLPEDIWGASPVAQLVKNLPAMQETGIRSVGQEDALEKEMATHSSILAWEIPRTEDSGRLQFIGSKDLNMTWRQKQHGDAWGPQQKDRTPRCQTFS